MSDIYRIAVAMTLSSNAHGFFSALAGQVLHLHRSLGHLENRINNIGRMRLAVGGGLSMAAGFGMLDGVVQTVEAAKKLNHELTITGTLLANNSRNPSQSQALQSQALAVARATAQQVRGVGYDKAVEVFNESYSVLGGAKNAAKANALLAMYAKVVGSTSGDPEKGYESIRELVKSGEMTGAIMDEKTHLIDETKLRNYLGIAAKFSAATAGRVNARTFFQIASQGSTGVKNMNDEGLMSMLMASQQMGGFKVGTATMSMFSQFAGGKMTMSVADELEKLGLAGAHNKGEGGGVQWEKGALNTPFIRALLKDPLSAMPILRNQMAMHGITDQEEQTKEMFKIFGRQTTQRLMTDFITNMENMLREKGIIKGAMGLQEQNDLYDNHEYDTALNNLNVAFHNLLDTLGLPMTQTAVDVMNKVADGIRFLDAQLQKFDPNTIAAVGKGIAITGVALMGGGAIALLAALGPAGWLAAGIIALGAAVLTWKPGALREFASGLKEAWSGIISGDWKTAWKGVVKEWSGLIDMLPNGLKDSIVKLDKEIRSWPGKLAGAIEAMGAGIVGMIEGKLKGLLGPQIKPAAPKTPGGVENDLFGLQSYGGGGVGEGLLRTIAYSNDNGGGAGGGSAKLVAGTITGGISNSNVVILASTRGGTGGGGGFGGFGGGGAGFAGGGHWNGRALALNGRSIGHVASQADRAAFIRSYAASIGIDPEVALRVAQSEGFYQYTGDNGTSFGDFQMHVGGGLGDRLRAMGIDPTDPRQWRAADKVALDIARREGWSAWHGAARVGIGNHQGIGIRPYSIPNKSQAPTVIHNKIHIDGKIVAQNTTRHQADEGNFPTSVGGLDTHGSFASPGTPLIDAA